MISWCLMFIFCLALCTSKHMQHNTQHTDRKYIKVRPLSHPVLYSDQNNSTLSHWLTCVCIFPVGHIHGHCNSLFPTVIFNTTVTIKLELGCILYAIKKWASCATLYVNLHDWIVTASDLLTACGVHNFCHYSKNKTAVCRFGD